MRRPFSIALALSLIAATCAEERTDADVRAFFSKGRIGYGVDYGLYQESQLRPGEWDHIATVHGMSDDLDYCTKIEEALEARMPGYRFDCHPLN